MKAICAFLALALIGAIFSGCTEKAFEARLGETAEVGYGNAVYIADEELKIEFSGDVFDSRCPLNYLCFWPGEIEVEFRIQKNGLPPAVSDAILGFSDEVSKPAYYYDYRITLLSVTPYPVEMNDIPNEIRMAKVRVERIDIGDSCSPDIGMLHFSDSPPQDLMRDEYDLLDVSLLGDTLTAYVRYGGGCQRHDFILYMDPPEFMESNPVQANLYLIHYGNDDHCLALVSDKVKFDIRPIAELCEQQYGQLDDIILNVYNYSLDELHRITYSPE